MASPIAIASALSTLMRIKCPHCGLTKTVVARRAPTVCPRCKHKLPAKKRAK